MVACHLELTLLLFDDEIGQVLLRGELIAEAQSIIEETKTNHHRPVVLLLTEGHQQLVVVVADTALLTPHRRPSLIERVGFGVSNGKARLHISLALNGLLFRKSLVLKICGLVWILFLQLKTQMAVANNSLALVGQIIGGTTFRIYAEVHLHLSIGGGQLLCIHPKCHQWQQET